MLFTIDFPEQLRKQFIVFRPPSGHAHDESCNKMLCFMIRHGLLPVVRPKVKFQHRTDGRAQRSYRRVSVIAQWHFKKLSKRQKMKVDRVTSTARERISRYAQVEWIYFGLEFSGDFRRIAKQVSNRINWLGCKLM